MKTSLIFFFAFFGFFGFLKINAQKTEKSAFPLSSSLVSGELVFVSGQIGIHPKTSKLSNDNFEVELRQVMENLKSELAKNNLKLDDLVNTTIYLTDMKNYNQLNEIYKTYFEKRFPTRTCIAVLALPANASVEISGIAELKKLNK